MATKELNALIRAKDATGNSSLIYPITRKENVDGLAEALASVKAYTDAEIAEWVGDTPISEQISTAIASKSDLGHTHDDRYYTESEIDSKLSGKSDTGHTHGEYVNQNAFTKVAVGSTTIEADSATDTLTLAAGNNITLTPDASGDKVTITATDTVYTHPNSDVPAGTYKSVTVNAQGHVTAGTNPTTLAGYGITDAESKGAANSALTSAKSYADSKVSTHDSSSTAHSDIRELITDHTHDDRYYTESEIDSKLSVLNTAISAKSDSSHNHDTAYDAKGSASTALSEAKTYADTVATTAAKNVKDDLLNGAGTAYDTLKELGDLIDTNTNAIDALETVAGGKADVDHTHDDRYYTESEIDSKISTLNTSISGKADATHTHIISDVTGLQTALDGKAATSHGTHVSYSTTAPKMDGVASIGEASTVSRSDHVHPTDTTRASQIALDSHIGDTTVHITSAERTKWNAAKTHADSAHAPSNAEKNQNAFSNIAVGSTTIAANSTTDTLTLAGSNVTITPDATNDKVTIGITKDNVTSALGYTPPMTDTTYTSLKNPYAVTIQGNGTSLGTYDGSSAKTFNITPSNIGAATSSHTHDDRYYTESEIDSKVATLNTSISGLQSVLDSKVPTTRTINGKTLSDDITLSASDVGAYTKAETDVCEFIATYDIDDICTNCEVHSMTLSSSGTLDLSTYMASLSVAYVYALSSQNTFDNSDDGMYDVFELDFRNNTGTFVCESSYSSMIKKEFLPSIYSNNIWSIDPTLLAYSEGDAFSVIFCKNKWADYSFENYLNR